MKHSFLKKGVAALFFALLLLTGCNQKDADTAASTTATEVAVTEVSEDTASAGETTEAQGNAPVADGIYKATFETDGSMFHVNEVMDGKGVLTVENGQMTIHLVMPSKNTVNLFLGLSEDAQKEGAKLIDPTVETVTYNDGLSEDVNAFDLPVPVLDEEFDVALIGTKGVWYDHKVKVSLVTLNEDAKETEESKASEAPADGTYTIEVTMSGGTGKATIDSPTALSVENGKMTATITWSSPHYDYMLVDGEKYLPVNTEGNSVFEIPVSALDTELTVIGDTTAMSEPHEVEYTLCFISSTLK